MTSTTAAMPALPAPRAQQVIQLRTVPDLVRRPAGAHLLPRELLADDDAHWDAEAEAFFTPRRPAEQHGRRCACGCRPVPPASEAA